MNNRLGYNPHIDGLRGVAILLVMGYHYFSGMYIFDIGWSGVDLFFVLSGYLLTSRLYPYLTDKKLLQKFYWNRFLRIVPLYFTFLIVFFSFAAFWASHKPTDEFDIYINNAPAFFLFFANWVYIKHDAFNFAYTTPLWSLSVEEQFYLIFPWFFIVCKNKKTLLKLGVFLLCAVLIFRCIYFSFFMKKGMDLDICFNSFFRADAFLMGFVLYMAIENGLYTKIEKFLHSIIYFGLTILLLGVIFNSSMRINPFFETIGFTIIAILYGCLLFQANASKGYFIKYILSKRFFIQTGKISFGLYIFHGPVYMVLFSLLLSTFKIFHFQPNTAMFKAILIIAAILGSYILSILSYKYYESFFLKFKKSPLKQMHNVSVKHLSETL
jgi:peptidoglycan/LPS O-acetylase OafA/YrhL